MLTCVLFYNCMFFCDIIAYDNDKEYLRLSCTLLYLQCINQLISNGCNLLYCKNKKFTSN